MTGSSMKKAPLMRVRRVMLGTDWIVRTKHPQIQSGLHYFVNLSSQLHQTTQSAFCIRCACIEEDAETNFGNGVNPLSYGTCCVPTSQRHRSQQQVRKGMHHQVGQVGRFTVCAGVLFAPGFESGSEGDCAITNGLPVHPILD